MDDFWLNAIWSLAPTVLIGLIFWFVMRSLLRAAGTERDAYAKIAAVVRATRAEQQHRAA